MAPYDPFHPKSQSIEACVKKPVTLSKERLHNATPDEATPEYVTVIYTDPPMPATRREALAYFEKFREDHGGVKKMHWIMPYLAATFFDQYASERGVPENHKEMFFLICLKLACETWGDTKLTDVLRGKLGAYGINQEKFMLQYIDTEPITPLVFVNHLLRYLPYINHETEDIGHIYAILVQAKADISLVFEKPLVMAAGAIMCYVQLRLEDAERARGGPSLVLKVGETFSTEAMAPRDVTQAGHVRDELLKMAGFFGDKDGLKQKKPSWLLTHGKQLVGLAAKHGDGQQRDDMNHIQFPLHWNEVYASLGDVGGSSSTSQNE